MTDRGPDDPDEIITGPPGDDAAEDFGDETDIEISFDDDPDETLTHDVLLTDHGEG